MVGLLDKIRERVENQEIAGLQDFPEEKDEKELAKENEKGSNEENGNQKTDGDGEKDESELKKEESDGEKRNEEG